MGYKSKTYKVQELYSIVPSLVVWKQVLTGRTCSLHGVMAGGGVEVLVEAVESVDAEDLVVVEAGTGALPRRSGLN